MKIVIPGLLLSAVLLILVGCQDSTPVQTVEWYKVHDAERMTLLQKCKSNSGVLETTPNCINAQRAETANDAAKRDGLNLPKGNIWKNSGK